MVQCLVGGRWTDFPLDKMKCTLNDGVLQVTNNSGVSTWAGIVSKRKFQGDYTIRVEVKNAKAVCLKSAVGDDSWAGADKLDGDAWKTVVITRKQGKVSVTVDGRPAADLVEVNTLGLFQAVLCIHFRSNATGAIRGFTLKTE
jgi:hypothetical protein